VYTSPSYTACGLLAYNALGATDVTNCVFADNSSGAYYYNVSGTIDASTITSANGLYDGVEVISDGRSSWGRSRRRGWRSPWTRACRAVRTCWRSW